MMTKSGCWENTVTPSFTHTTYHVLSAGQSRNCGVIVVCVGLMMKRIRLCKRIKFQPRSRYGNDWEDLNWIPIDWYLPSSILGMDKRAPRGREMGVLRCKSHLNKNPIFYIHRNQSESVRAQSESNICMENTGRCEGSAVGRVEGSS